MADSRTVTVVPLNGTNYPTWKKHCRMALMKEGLWRIVTGQETVPTGSEVEQAKFAARRDCALATVVLSVKVAGKLPHKRNNCFRFTPTIVQLVFLFE